MTYKHQWHLTSNYCIHCGLARDHELDEPYPCHREKNVIAISHITSMKRMRELLNVIRTSSKGNDSDT
jgi:hypothetical protein